MKTPHEISAATAPAPVCRFLRTKRMYIPAMAEGALDLESYHNDQSFYWCGKTLAALGEDDQAVHPCVCTPGRSCHEV